MAKKEKYMVIERKYLGINGYMSPTRIIPTLGSEYFPYQNMRRPQKFECSIETRDGIQNIVFEDLPNDFCKKRESFLDWFHNKKTDLNEGTRFHMSSVYGFVTEAHAQNLFSHLLPGLETVFLPEAYDATIVGERRGADLMIMKQLPSGAGQPVMLVDVTAQCTSGLARKRPGINPELDAPIFVLPLGDLYKQDYGRMYNFLNSVLLPAIKTREYHPLIGVDDYDSFSAQFLEMLDQQIGFAGADLLTQLQVSNQKFVESYEIAIRKLGVMKKYIQSLK